MQMSCIQFYDDVIDVVRDEKGVLWVSVRSVCDGLGVDWPSQRAKIKMDCKFNCGDITIVAKDGRNREMTCIPVSQLNGWLFGINANKVREEIRPRLLRYQQECMDVLHKHFMPNGGSFEEVSMQLQEFRYEINQKLDGLNGLAETAFGDDKKLIQDLVRDVASVYGVSGNVVWGWVQTECDVSSYKKQNVKVINFLRNKLGKGVFGVVKDET